jgi:hypothetical protein
MVPLLCVTLDGRPATAGRCADCMPAVSFALSPGDGAATQGGFPVGEERE